ncbi:hypothetical protein [Acetobacter persici]|uniref:Uncharacterized protein n=1 Tax=Acetobacter persici TaxID=1076596 RepID=A0A1U9LJW4_9PROT|nr:hypothetical protein [Acetobacter persici]AQT06712.1 hypothetical protein A0U91_17060 [Acetobacter persici]
MADPEARSLENRIQDEDREWQLRFDATMGRIDGKFNSIMSSAQNIERSIFLISECNRKIKLMIVGTSIVMVLAIASAVFCRQIVAVVFG